MKPVDQTILTAPGGNCFAACVASILELPLADVPNFCSEERWWNALQIWLRPRGLFAFEVVNGESVTTPPAPCVPCIISGKSPRFDSDHSVVGAFRADGSGWDYLHDPHPSRNFLGGDPTAFLYFCMLRPELFRSIQQP